MDLEELRKLCQLMREEGLSELEQKLSDGAIKPEKPIVVLTYGMRMEPVHLVKIIQMK